MKFKMKSFCLSVVSLALLAPALAQTNPSPPTSEGQGKQTITRAGSQPSQRGPAENFTGSVSVDPLFTAEAAAPYAGAYVTFQAGARSNWHVHPPGQRLVVTAGVGRTAEWGGPVREIRPGDVVWCPPGVKHWHGASPNSIMTHLALTGMVNNRNVEWLERVTDEQYSMATDQKTSAAAETSEQSKMAQQNEMMIRISEVEIHSAELDEYKATLKEEAAASVELEPGVIAIFPMYQRENPTEVRILEIYADRAAYESHLKTPHFQHYKTTTLKMVKSLKLVDMETIDADTVTWIFEKMKRDKDTQTH